MLGTNVPIISRFTSFRKFSRRPVLVAITPPGMSHKRRSPTYPRLGDTLGFGMYTKPTSSVDLPRFLPENMRVHDCSVLTIIVWPSTAVHLPVCT